MPRHFPLHIRATRSTAAYCGARAGAGIQVFPQSRAREDVAAGKATRYCPACLASALEHGTRASEAARVANRARQQALSQDQRRKIALNAVTVRWERLRARQGADGLQEPR